ncbi:hypothetical protein [Sinomonas susongensis]|uniref:hypothetical protein n=1 Tax=Sinomonas susongensis TaxID=1324851 RepID=UPI0011080B58|nr:hypothetical protein [Sinomonas susongensis]
MTKLTMTELAAETTELLPGRETLFWGGFNVNTALVAAQNSSAAVNAATILSSANSAALQGIWVSQR